MELFVDILLLTTLAAVGYTSSADITTYCSEYTDGESVNASVTINTTAVTERLCIPTTLNEIFFQFWTTLNNTFVKEYNAAYNLTGPCDGTWKADVSCASHDKANNTITYMLRFVASKILHSQQYLTVRTSCIELDPNITFTTNYSSCYPIPFRIDTTTSAAVTTTYASRTDKTTPIVDVTTSASNKGVYSSTDLQVLELLVIWSVTKVICFI